MDRYTVRFYFNCDRLNQCSTLSEVPEEVEDWCSVAEAISYVQSLGCQGRSQHKIQSEYHKLVLAVLRWAVENEGEMFPEVLRGVRSDRPDENSLILFGTRDAEVAQFYARNNIKTYKNIKGLLTYSTKESVKGGFEMDEEIIFFPLILLPQDQF
jgi:hypothetical protein